MGRFIAKIEDDKGRWHWFERGTSVDAPVSCSMSRVEMIGHLLWHAKADSWETWIDDGRMIRQEAVLELLKIYKRIARVEEFGCSSHCEMSGEDLIDVNRYGEDEASLSKEELIAKLVAARERQHRWLAKTHRRPWGTASSCGLLVMTWAAWLRKGVCFGGIKGDWAQEMLKLMAEPRPERLKERCDDG